MREITIAWMYHDIMDLYGDKGNIIVFKKRCEDRGIQCNVDTVGIDEPYDFKKCDILFIGGGADKEQGAMYNDLVRRKQAIVDAMSEGMLVLLICGGYQLFGKYYEDADGNKLEGLGIFDYYTVSVGKTRSIGNIVIETMLNGESVKVVGFENHGGKTYNVLKPFGKVLYGNGNEINGYEGYFDGKTLGTYMHGPLLPKNVAIADYFISEALKRHNDDGALINLNDELSIKARDFMIEKCIKNK